MTAHSEETNELFNLMARQIKKRCEERINLYQVEEKNWKGQDALLDEKDLDELILANEDYTEMEYARNAQQVLGATTINMQQSTSRGNSPPKDNDGMAQPTDTMMHTMLS